MTMTTPESASSTAPTSWGIISVIIMAVIGIVVYALSPSSNEPINEKRIITNSAANSQHDKVTESISKKHIAIKEIEINKNGGSDITESRDENSNNQILENKAQTLSFDSMKGENSAAEIPESASQSANPTPHLNNSDNWLIKQLIQYVPDEALHSLVVKNDTARKLVVFIDNFAQGIVAYQHSPLAKVPQPFKVKPIESISVDSIPVEPMPVDPVPVAAAPNQQTSQTVPIVKQLKAEQNYIAATNNTERFSPYIDLFLAIDNQRLVDWYKQLLPLLNQAYQELGYEEQFFTDTVHLAIGRITTFDMPKNASTLIQPHVMYKYRDKSIEALPDAEKLLIRLGDENLSKLQDKLKQISQLLY